MRHNRWRGDFVSGPEVTRAAVGPRPATRILESRLGQVEGALA